MPLVARSDLSTGNSLCASYVCQSRHLVFAFTAPTSIGDENENGNGNEDGKKSSPSSLSCPYPNYSRQEARAFVAKHGLAVRAVGLVVADAREAFAAAVAGGAAPASAPADAVDAADGGRTQTSAEVVLYGDVRLRFVSGDSEVPFLAGYAAEPGGREVAFAPGVASAENEGVSGGGGVLSGADGEKTSSSPSLLTLGLDRLDHAVSNVPELLPVANAVAAMTGFHEFAEFTAEDVGTVDSGLNSVVLANDAENVLLPINEPTHGTRRVSQIQTFLDHHGGPGVQHLALKTDDAFATLRELRRRASRGGFELMPPASKEYYDNLPAKLSRGGDECPLTEQQLRECRELGLLVDRDDQVRVFFSSFFFSFTFLLSRSLFFPSLSLFLPLLPSHLQQGVLLQIFTRPLSDRPTIFLEIIQRIGCVRMVPAKEAAERRESAATAALARKKVEEKGKVKVKVVASSSNAEDEEEACPTVLEQAGGCGGFGKGNFSELFKSIEDYEKTLGV